MEAVGKQEIAYYKLARVKYGLVLLRYNIFPSNLFLFYLVFSFKELKLFLNGYVFPDFNLARSTSYSRHFSYSRYEVVRFLFSDQIIDPDRTHLLVVQDLFHVILDSISHDVDLWNNSDSLGVANHHTFGFLENKSYGFDGSLFSLLGDHCVKFQEEVIEHSQYVLTSLDTYVKNLVGKILVRNLLLVEKGLLEHLWHGLNFLLFGDNF
ncbi:hypothetical protein M9H77_07563 [Catharanthus roseus]|uniref:Uncharacterized protein n=1 Tax=Catharanthus roseus TaxID=4058 RepID=A0ACC0BVB2_CATRO|nr:hypothetical protein M9H77_07563 [Catharanthus roseus]